nr:MAG TPA: hypothetical protein [Caudoviricetes sp.]
MSKKNPSVVDYFDLNGDLNEEAYEFEDVKLEDYIDKRSNIKPSWIGKYSHQMHFDLDGGTEVSFYNGRNIIYADILFSGGIRTILFKCRQKKNLTRFISRVLELSQGEPSNIHPDFRA